MFLPVRPGMADLRCTVKRRARGSPGLGALLTGILFAALSLLYSQTPLLTNGNMLEENAPMAADQRPNLLTVRVGILEDYKRITFQMHGRYCIETLDSTTLRETARSDLKWRARIENSEPAQFLFSVLVNAFERQQQAMDLAESFESRDLSAAVRQVGGPIEMGDHIVGDNTLYRVQVGNFKTAADAAELRRSLDDEFTTQVVREVLRDAHGTIELYDADLNENFTIKRGFRLVPQTADAYVTIFGVRTNSGFHYEPTEDRDYAGIVEVYFDHDGQLGVINEIPVDVYLRGVVPAEMPASFPVEALKAQAILARTVVLAEKSIKHLNDPYELCGHVHCQVYSGLTHEDPRSTAAVDETRGTVLFNREHLVPAHYSAVCGGHTEDAQATWLMSPGNPLAGRVCSCNNHLVVPDLSTETGVRKWIQSSPDVCCNLSSLDLPVSADYARRRFRWEVAYSRPELEQIIRDKTGVDVGTIYDVLPIHRGRSGRLIEVEVLGSRRNLKIKRELRIRRALSSTALASSCFVVDLVNDSTGVPAEIIFSGAGWGHGVGMCQCGAARQAAEGKTFPEILQFYFPGTRTVKLY